MTNEMSNLDKVLNDIREERTRQDQKWGGPGHDNGHSVPTWVRLVQNYAGWAEVMHGTGSHGKARMRLMQVAAIAVAACESLDRQIAELDEEMFRVAFPPAEEPK